MGEFGPIYTGSEAEDARLRGILADQLDLYRRHSASWALWMYKDIGRQGLVSVRPDTPYRRRFDDFVAKKNRLAADQWGSDGVGVAEVTQPVQDLIAQEFPDFDPYPWGRFDWVRTLLLNITIAQPLAYEQTRGVRLHGPPELTVWTPGLRRGAQPSRPRSPAGSACLAWAGAKETESRSPPVGGHREPARRLADRLRRAIGEIAGEGAVPTAFGGPLRPCRPVAEKQCRITETPLASRSSPEGLRDRVLGSSGSRRWTTSGFPTDRAIAICAENARR